MDYELNGHFVKQSEIPHCVDKISTLDEEEDRGRTHGCGVWVLAVAAIACGFGCFVMMSTNLFSLLIQKNLTLKNNSMRFQTWKQPPVHALFRVYLFNYTNIEDYESGRDKKLKIEELGPYTYVETLERVNVTYNGDGTLRYKDKKTYRFSHELSSGSELDRLIVPNIPFMAAMSVAKTNGFLARLGILSLLKMTESLPFIELSVKEYLWGYNDKLSDLTNTVLNLKYKTSVKMFGIFAMKNRTQEDEVTIFTGEEDVMRTGIISRYGDSSELDYWGTKECNRIDGTDGTIYPPGAVKPNSTLYLYVKDMCRRVPMVYESSKVEQHGVPVLRYTVARDVFESGKINPENRCFCNRGDKDIDCMPSGVFNVSPCAFGGPIITSLPHFLYGDPALSEDFDGLSPHPGIHESFFEIDPRLGVPMSGKSRFQLNVMMRKTAGFLGPYKDKLILPVSWMDYGVDRLPDEVFSMVYNLILFINVTEIFLSVCFVIAVFVLCGLIVKRLVPRSRSGLLRKNFDLSTVDMPLVVCPEK